jgi:hypothetical protein
MLLMALRKSLILRKSRSGCLEGCTALIQLIVDFFTCSSRVTEDEGTGVICLVPNPSGGKVAQRWYSTRSTTK